MGTRADGLENEPTTLQFQFLKNGLPYEPEEVKCVEIYPSYADAEAGTNIIQTIAAVDIDHLGDGLLEYIAAAIATSGTYFDKPILTPDIGKPDWNKINPFYIRKESYGGSAPGSIELCRVRVNVFDFLTNPSKSTVKITMNKKSVWYENELIQTEPIVREPDSTGAVIVDLVETETLGVDVHYIFDIGDGLYKVKKTIPKGTLDANLKDLPDA